jgi:hypothetical protein
MGFPFPDHTKLNFAVPPDAGVKEKVYWVQGGPGSGFKDVVPERTLVEVTVTFIASRLEGSTG